MAVLEQRIIKEDIFGRLSSDKDVRERSIVFVRSRRVVLDKVPKMGTVMHATGPMRVISRRQLKTFWEVHGRAEKPLRAWFHEAKVAKWKNFQDIKKNFPTADVLPHNRVIFDIKGNDYRLIVKIHYNTGIVFIRFVGTHPEYDQIDPQTI